MITRSKELLANDPAGPRFFADPLPSGLFGVYDIRLGIYVVRDAPQAFAVAVAERLNDPDWWESSEPQRAADAVRRVLFAQHTVTSSDPLH